MDQEFLDEYTNNVERTVRLQNIWDTITNIIGYSLIAASIISGLYLGYWGSTAFTVFCVAAAVYFFSKYYYFPYVAEYQYRPVEYRKGSFGVAYRENFASILGTGEVLYGRFGWHNEGFYKSRTYCFISLLYIPLFPIGCYDFWGKRKMVQFDSYSRESDGAYDLTKINWDFREILYVYMKNWSFAVMVITVINTIMWDYVNPAIYG